MAKESLKVLTQNINLTELEELNKLGKKAIHISNYDDIEKYLSERIKPNDLILTLGAGYVTKLSDMLTK